MALRCVTDGRADRELVLLVFVVLFVLVTDMGDSVCLGGMVYRSRSSVAFAIGARRHERTVDAHVSGFAFVDSECLQIGTPLSSDLNRRLVIISSFSLCLRGFRIAYNRNDIVVEEYDNNPFFIIARGRKD